MYELDPITVKQNVKHLMEERNIRPDDLRVVIDVHQPQMSKLLNEKDTARFAIRHLYAISQEYHVSIDSLVGNSNRTSSDTSVFDICKTLSSLMQENIISYELKAIKEDNAYSMCTDSEIPEYGYYFPTSKPTAYYTFYFSNYEKLQTSFKDEDDKFEYDDILRSRGNDNKKNKKINKFLTTFIEELELYKQGKLSVESFNTIKHALLTELK